MKSCRPDRAMPRYRRGVALVVVLICLGVVSSMLMCMGRATLLEQRQITSWQRHEQVLWLMEAGVQRATEALDQRADYRAEIWQVAIPSTPSADGDDQSSAPSATISRAEVTLTVAEPTSASYPLRVTVRYPLEADFPIQVTRETAISAREVPSGATN